MQTGNTERLLLTGIHIHGNMEILVAQIDSNMGIDITFEGKATDLEFVEQFPDYMA